MACTAHRASTATGPTGSTGKATPQSSSSIPAASNSSAKPQPSKPDPHPFIAALKTALASSSPTENLSNIVLLGTANAKTAALETELQAALWHELVLPALRQFPKPAQPSASPQHAAILSDLAEYTEQLVYARARDLHRNLDTTQIGLLDAVNACSLDDGNAASAPATEHCHAASKLLTLVNYVKTPPAAPNFVGGTDPWGHAVTLPNFVEAAAQLGFSQAMLDAAFERVLVRVVEEGRRPTSLTPVTHIGPVLAAYQLGVLRFARPEERTQDRTQFGKLPPLPSAADVLATRFPRALTTEIRRVMPTWGAYMAVSHALDNERRSSAFRELVHSRAGGDFDDGDDCQPWTRSYGQCRFMQLALEDYAELSGLLEPNPKHGSDRPERVASVTQELLQHLELAGVERKQLLELAASFFKDRAADVVSTVSAPFVELKGPLRRLDDAPRAWESECPDNAPHAPHPLVPPRKLAGRGRIQQVRVFRRPNTLACSPIQECSLAMKTDAGWYATQGVHCQGIIGPTTSMRRANESLRWLPNTELIEYSYEVVRSDGHVMRRVLLCGVDQTGVPACIPPFSTACKSYDGQHTVSWSIKDDLLTISPDADEFSPCSTAPPGSFRIPLVLRLTSRNRFSVAPSR